MLKRRPYHRIITCSGRQGTILTRRLPALCFVAALLMAIAFASCGIVAPDGAGASGQGADGVPADGEDYDFSVFFGHAEDPITVARIALRYKAETGVSVRPITTADAADDARFLRRYLNSSDPPAAYALPAGAGEFVSAGGVGWRFRGSGFAADRRVLADLIAAPAATAPAVDAFVEDIRLADYREWSAFLDSLDAYIKGAGSAPVTLNNREYSFAGAKGRYSSQLNGVFAVSGADPSFVGSSLMDMATLTSNREAIESSRRLATPQAFTIAAPFIGAYVDALDVYTSHLSGLYASGVRGDDFVNAEIYGPGYTASVFSECRAVFTPFDSKDYEENGYADATQAEYLALLPVKMPYYEHWLSGYYEAQAANASLRMSTEYALCVNDQVDQAAGEKAQAFVEWLLADDESIDAVQLRLTEYNNNGTRLPLETDEKNADENGASAFGEEIFKSALIPLLSDPEWRPEEKNAFGGVLFTMWNRGD
jgi:hypothetical protein